MHGNYDLNTGTRVSYLKELAAKGGPEVAEYGELDQYFSELGDMVRRGLITSEQFSTAWQEMPHLFLSSDNMLGFTVLKPHGYAGDFEMIDRIYQQRTSTDPLLAKWDQYFHAQPATQAVRNRKVYFHDLLKSISCKKCEEVKTILNIGSGPGRDMRDAFDAGIHGVDIDCVDLDQSAIEYAAALVEPYAANVNFIRCNALKFKPAREYDLVWSAGLFDYLDDRTFKYLLGRLLTMVKAGGRIVIGNFSEQNPTRDFMEFGHWFLHHRSEHDLLTLARECGVSDASISVESEAAGVNLFLHIEHYHAL